MPIKSKSVGRINTRGGSVRDSGWGTEEISLTSVCLTTSDDTDDEVGPPHPLLHQQQRTNQKRSTAQLW